MDLSKPEVGIVLSARRILRRDESHKKEIALPLTLQRIFQEYRSFQMNFDGGGKRISNSNGKNDPFNTDTLQQTQAAMNLFERGVLIPSMDHSGGGPLQYQCLDLYKELDHYSLLRMPVHMPIEIHREIGEALKNLDFIQINTNSLSGPIPDTFGELKRLRKNSKWRDQKMFEEKLAPEF